ncbi:MAG: helix-turn-helix domain-containing protein [Planctomycetaceae bacterium]
MAGKFLSPEEAARHLGVTIEEVNRLVDRKKLFPIRDGATVKFKLDEIERVVADMADDLAGDANASDLNLDLSSPALAAGSGLGDDLILGDAVDGEDLAIGDAGSALASSDLELDSIINSSSPSAVKGGGSASGVGSNVAGGSGTLEIDLGSGVVAGLSSATPAPLAGAMGDSGLSLEGDLGGSGVQLGGSGLELGSGPALAGSGRSLAGSGPSLGGSGLDLGGSGIGGGGGSGIGGGGGSGIGDALGGDAFDLGGATTDDDSGSVVIPTEDSGDSSFFGAAIDDSSSISIEGDTDSAALVAPGEDFLDRAGPGFNVLQIVGLVCCTLLLTTSALVMIDLVGSLRAPTGTPISSPLLKALTDLFSWP